MGSTSSSTWVPSCYGSLEGDEVSEGTRGAAQTELYEYVRTHDFDGKGVVASIRAERLFDPVVVPILVTRSSVYSAAQQPGEQTGGSSSESSVEDARFLVDDAPPTVNERATMRSICATSPFDAALGWFAFDLGARRKLCVHEFSLMHGAPGGMMRARNFVLEGSCSAPVVADAAGSWIELSVKANCDDLPDERYATASWTVTGGEASKTWVRSLRVRLTEPHATGSRSLYVGGIEFYGLLRRTQL